HAEGFDELRVGGKVRAPLGEIVGDADLLLSGAGCPGTQSRVHPNRSSRGKAIGRRRRRIRDVARFGVVEKCAVRGPCRQNDRNNATGRGQGKGDPPRGECRAPQLRIRPEPAHLLTSSRPSQESAGATCLRRTTLIQESSPRIGSISRSATTRTP